MKRKRVQIKTDLEQTYLVQLTTKANPYATELRQVKITRCGDNTNMLRCIDIENPNAYETHYYYDEFFQWLLYTGKIIAID